MTRIIDSEFEHGPTNNRKRTDIICYAFIIGVLIFSGISIRSQTKEIKGEFLTPVDFFGNKCGQGDAKNFPFLYLPTYDPDTYKHETLNPVKNSVCISRCGEIEDGPRKCFPNANYPEGWCEKNLNSSEGALLETYLGKSCFKNLSIPHDMVMEEDPEKEQNKVKSDEF